MSESQNDPLMGLLTDIAGAVATLTMPADPVPEEIPTERKIRTR